MIAQTTVLLDQKNAQPAVAARAIRPGRDAVVVGDAPVEVQGSPKAKDRITWLEAVAIIGH